MESDVKKPACFICNKELKFLSEEHDQINNGGNVQISCHYGSRHDMEIGISNNKPFNTYICDDCFDKLKNDQSK